MVYPILRAGAPNAWEDLFGSPGDLDHALSRFLTHRSTASDWTPAVDVRETADALFVQAELPGLGRDDVTLNVENGVLTIAGSKHRVETDPADQWHRAERGFGQFERRFTLPRTVDVATITAGFADGILTVTLPKADSAKPRRIEIAVEAVAKA